MFELYMNGSRLVTTDDVGAAVLAHSRTLTSLGRSAIIEFPVLAGGQPAFASATSGYDAPITAVHIPDDPNIPFILEGSSEATRAIRRAALGADSPT
ncbi:hypothetical protein [Microbacterium sp. 10M-3C3]|jgi:hypothetical protein|uniref:hypothetical protein n=1 Tax=Microbacterium sp. 10M-3C3 TaxID=2483401 RepID=UPI000F63C3A3|nr:hypothetical protein [Microbacterium sp. 10M-3C3]